MMRKRLLAVVCCLCVLRIAFAGEMKAYFGLLHAHTRYPDGQGHGPTAPVPEGRAPAG